MHALSVYFIVFLGSGLGGALRHAVNVIVPRLLGSDYPHSTILVNVGGSFIMGLMAGWFAFKGDSSQAWRLFLATGVLGGFTTFRHFLWIPRYCGNAVRLGTQRFMLLRL
jgi:CrcB protein